MNDQPNIQRPGDEQRAASARIGAADRLLRDDGHGVPAGFAELLFEHAAPEDVVAYEARELAALARDAWTFLADRNPGAAKIRFDQPSIEGDRLKSVSVIEIVNDDMPFLVDSVMGELAERGLMPRLVVHPILAVERAASGKLAAAPVLANHGVETRESFIHLHVARIEDAGRRAEVVQALEQVLGRGPRSRGGLEADAGPRRRGDRRSQDQSAAAAGR